MKTASPRRRALTAAVATRPATTRAPRVSAKASPSTRRNPIAGAVSGIASDAGAKTSTKFCSMCQEHLPRSAFSKKTDGYCMSRCKPCRALLSRVYRIEHPDKVRAARLKWELENPEHAAAIHAADVAMRSKRLKEARVELSERQRKQVLDAYSLAQRLTRETGIEWQVDHYVPVARGGKHTPRNLQVIPAKVNEHKGPKVFRDYAEYWAWMEINHPNCYAYPIANKPKN